MGKFCGLLFWATLYMSKIVFIDLVYWTGVVTEMHRFQQSMDQFVVQLASSLADTVCAVFEMAASV